MPDAAAGDVVIEARALGRVFATAGGAGPGGDVEAVRDVSFVVRKGECVGFVGHNGAGKSTTMRMLAGALAPSRGRALVGGDDSITLEARRRVGWLPETPPLTPELTVAEQLRFAARLRGLTGAALSRAISDALARCDLGGARDRVNATLSKGTKQRVGLAQALIGDAPALLLDEPTAGLDPQQAESVRALIRGLTAERAILLSTHLVHEVAALCTRAVLLARGSVVADAPIDELRARATAETAAGSGAGAALEGTVLAALRT